MTVNMLPFATVTLLWAFWPLSVWADIEDKCEWDKNGVYQLTACPDGYTHLMVENDVKCVRNLTLAGDQLSLEALLSNPCRVFGPNATMNVIESATENMLAYRQRFLDETPFFFTGHYKLNGKWWALNCKPILFARMTDATGDNAPNGSIAIQEMRWNPYSPTEGLRKFPTVFCETPAIWKGPGSCPNKPSDNRPNRDLKLYTCGENHHDNGWALHTDYTGTPYCYIYYMSTPPANDRYVQGKQCYDHRFQGFEGTNEKAFPVSMHGVDEINYVSYVMPLVGIGAYIPPPLNIYNMNNYRWADGTPWNTAKKVEYRDGYGRYALLVNQRWVAVKSFGHFFACKKRATYIGQYRVWALSGLKDPKARTVPCTKVTTTTPTNTSMQTNAPLIATTKDGTIVSSATTKHYVHKSCYT